MLAEEEGGGFTTSTGPVRVITAASLFDGHDAAINVMRRLIQSTGAEVIHLGHDRSAKDVAHSGAIARARTPSGRLARPSRRYEPPLEGELS